MLPYVFPQELFLKLSAYASENAINAFKEFALLRVIY